MNEDQRAKNPTTKKPWVSQYARWHDLKTWPEHWQDVFDGRKTFEVRRNDRDFSIGDGLNLKEWNPETGDYTGRQCFRMVTHIS